MKGKRIILYIDDLDDLREQMKKLDGDETVIIKFKHKAMKTCDPYWTDINPDHIYSPSKTRDYHRNKFNNKFNP
jgi:hypothetical protein